MSEEKPENSDKKPAAKIERDLISVAYKAKPNVVLMAVFLGVAILAIIFVVLDGMKKNNKASLTKQEEVVFRTPNGNAAPYIAEQAPKKGKPDTPLQPKDPELQKELLRLLAEKEQQRLERLKAPQLIYDEPALTKKVRGLPNTNSFETENASRLQDLNSLIPQGTLISGILETAIQSDLSGMVRAIVSENVYSFDGSELLIPKGSRLIGRYKSKITKGQTRLYVIWERLITNSGVSVNLNSLGTDALGRVGLSGDVDTHFFERFGSSVLLSLIDTSLEIGAEAITDENSSTIALQTGQDFSNASEIALKDSINIPPTIHINQGQRIKVFVGQDLSFSGM